MTLLPETVEPVATARRANAAAPAPMRQEATACPALDDIPGLRTPERRSIAGRLGRRVDTQVILRCRALLEQRLAAASAAERAASLPDRAARADTVRALLRALSAAEAVTLLSPGGAEDTAGRLLRRLLAEGGSMLREAALDALLGATDRFAGRTDERLHRACLDLLRPVFVLFGVDPSPLPTTPGEIGDEVGGEIGGEAAFLAALQTGANDAALRALARDAGVDPARARNAAMLRDRRALVSLAWKAGYSMRAAVQLQVRLAGIPPDLALGPTETGTCPLDRSEMAWQLGTLADATP